jgi:hypothetical protein
LAIIATAAPVVFGYVVGEPDAATDDERQHQKGKPGSSTSGAGNRPPQRRWFHDTLVVLEQRRITLGELPGAARCDAIASRLLPSLPFG